jgi:transcriptional regulator with XRE-family HTH domain
MAGEAMAHVQGESLKVIAVVFGRLLNSPATSGAGGRFTERGVTMTDPTKSPSKSPSDADRRIGRRIRLRRLSRGLSQEALASMLGLTFQQVQKYERGTNRISAGRLDEIARVLRVPVAVFYDGEDAGEQADSPALALMATSQGMRLFRAFGAIGSPELRRKALEMLEVVAGMKA